MLFNLGSKAEQLGMKYDNLDTPSLEKIAQAGDTEAQYEMGMRFSKWIKNKKGKNINNPNYDQHKEVDWLKMASEHGSSIAQSALADYYAIFDKNEDLYFKWKKASAEAGFVPARMQLASIYAGKSDKENTLYWLIEAAKDEKGVAAHLYLATLYGGDVMRHLNVMQQFNFQPDYIKAYTHLLLAKDLKYKFRPYFKELENHMTNDEIKLAKKSAKDWKEEYYNKGK